MQLTDLVKQFTDAASGEKHSFLKVLELNDAFNEIIEFFMTTGKDNPERKKIMDEVDANYLPKTDTDDQNKAYIASIVAIMRHADVEFNNRYVDMKYTTNAYDSVNGTISEALGREASSPLKHKLNN